MVPVLSESLPPRVMHQPPMPRVPFPSALLVAGATSGALFVLGSAWRAPTAAVAVAWAACTAVVLFMLARARGGGSWLVLVMAALGAVAALRWMLVAAGSGLLPWVAPVAGLLVGVHAWAGWQSSLRVPVAQPVDGAWAALLVRARESHADLVAELRHHADVREARVLRNAATTLLETVSATGAAWTRMERAATPELLASVVSRRAELEGRIAGATDELARAEWLRTEGSLQDQERAMTRIQQASARAMARAESQVTQLQTARLGVMAWAAQDEAFRAQEATRMAALIEESRAELDVAAGAMEEVQRVAG